MMNTDKLIKLSDTANYVIRRNYKSKMGLTKEQTLKIFNLPKSFFKENMVILNNDQMLRVGLYLKLYRCLKSLYGSNETLVSRYSKLYLLKILKESDDGNNQEKLEKTFVYYVRGLMSEIVWYD